MAPPSQLTIATNVVVRLLKEKTSYQGELLNQTRQIAHQQAAVESGAGDEDGNGEYILRQLRRARSETEAVFGPLQTHIQDAVRALEAHMHQSAQPPDEAALAMAQEALDMAAQSLENEPFVDGRESLKEETKP